MGYGGGDKIETMNMPKVEKSKLNIITTLLNQLTTTACGVVIPRILIGAFGSEAYGISVSITQFLSYITLLEGGVGSVARAKLYGPLARRDDREIGAVYYAVKSFFQHVAGAFLIYSIVLSLVYYDIAHVSIFSRTYVFSLVLVIGISTLAKYMGGLASLTLIAADQKQYINNVIVVGATLANTAAILILVRLQCDLIWVKLGSSLIFVIRPVLYTVYVRRHYTLVKTKKEKAILEQKWTGIGQHIAYFLHRNIDVVLLTLFANARLVAVYSVYSLIIGSIRAITESFAGGMEAAFGEMIAKKQIENLQRAYRKYQALLTSSSVILFCCTGILIVPFVQLYTNGITDANYIQPFFALILLMAEAVNCMTLPCSSLPIAANHLKQTRWGAYGEAIINITISCVLIRWNPLLGVAVGTLTATVFRGVFYMAYSSKYILHLRVYKFLFHFAGAASILCISIFVGRILLQSVTISNYVQWILYGIAVFASVSLPTVFFYRRRMRKEERGAQNEAYSDCQ